MNIYKSLSVGLHFLLGFTAAQRGAWSHGGTAQPLKAQGDAWHSVAAPNLDFGVAKPNPLFAALQEAPDCTRNTRHAACQLTQTTSEDDRLADNLEARHRVLVIDYGMEPSSLGIYKNRVAARYGANLTGHLVPHIDKLPVYQGFAALISHGIGDTRQALPVTTAYDAVALDIETKLTANLPVAKHGLPIFNFLAEANPTTAFVLMQHPQPPADIFCHSHMDSIREFYRNAALSIPTIVQRHNVSFINLSSGLDGTELNSLFSAHCPGGRLHPHKARQTLEAARVFYRALAQDPHVLMAHSAFRSHHAHEREAAILDCTTSHMPYRLRAEFVSYANNDIPPEGRGISALASHALGSPHCVDVYFNSGYQGETIEVANAHPLVLKRGAGFAPLAFWLGSSWAAPVLVSYVNHQLHQSQDPLAPLNASAWVTHIASRPEPWVFDPLANGQLLHVPVMPRYSSP